MVVIWLVITDQFFRSVIWLFLVVMDEVLGSWKLSFKAPLNWAIWFLWTLSYVALNKLNYWALIELSYVAFVELSYWALDELRSYVALKHLSSWVLIGV